MITFNGNDENLYEKLKEVINSDPNAHVVYPYRSHCRAKVENCNWRTNEIAKAAGFNYFTAADHVRIYYVLEPLGCTYYGI